MPRIATCYVCHYVYGPNQPMVPVLHAGKDKMEMVCKQCFTELSEHGRDRKTAVREIRDRGAAIARNNRKAFED